MSEYLFRLGALFAFLVVGALAVGWLLAKMGFVRVVRDDGRQDG